MNLKMSEALQFIDQNTPIIKNLSHEGYLSSIMLRCKEPKNHILLTHNHYKYERIHSLFG